MLPSFDTPRRQAAEIDFILFWSVLFLLFLGTVMVYSATIPKSESGAFAGNHPAYFLFRHSIFLAAGLIAAGCAFQVPMTTWQQCAPWLFMLGFVLLMLVWVPSVGRSVNGARRWLSLGIINLQPSELMKLFAVIYAADYTVRKMPCMHDLKKAFLPIAAIMVVVGVILLKEPDFGAFVVVISIVAGVLFLGGMRARLFASLILGLLIAFAALIYFSEYRRERIFSYIDPWKDPFGRGYQLTNALIAFGRGGIWGVGLGASVGKLDYLPEAHTDFLLAVIAEELGLIGVIIVISLFALIIQRAFVIGRQAVALDRLYSALVAQGVGIWVGVQSFINMGVNMGLLPTKGLTLPLMSFGGSGIFVNCVALALLLRVDWENRQLMRGGKV